MDKFKLKKEISDSLNLIQKKYINFHEIVMWLVEEQRVESENIYDLYNNIGVVLKKHFLFESYGSFSVSLNKKVVRKDLPNNIKSIADFLIGIDEKNSSNTIEYNYKKALIEIDLKLHLKDINTNLIDIKNTSVNHNLYKEIGSIASTFRHSSQGKHDHILPYLSSLIIRWGNPRILNEHFGKKFLNLEI